jgi:hypothetical protein
MLAIRTRKKATRDSYTKKGNATRGYAAPDSALVGREGTHTKKERKEKEKERKKKGTENQHSTHKGLPQSTHLPYFRNCPWK